MKLASEEVFYSPHASPVDILKALKSMGISVLSWDPEVLMAEIDRKYKGWTPERVAQAIEHFHKTGMLDTEVPPLVRNKIYAIRLISTSDSAHQEWNTFEKVGGAFNDRIPQFGLVEPMSAAECARTIELIEQIRPDTYSDEVKIYVAACCHTDGLFTVKPVRSLAPSETFLCKMIADEGADDSDLKSKIIEAFSLIDKPSFVVDVDNIVSVQAMKLAAINQFAREGLV
jgi:hypothetical protein